MKWIFFLSLWIHLGNANSIEELLECPFDPELKALTELICIPSNYSKITEPEPEMLVYVQIEDAPKVQDASKSISMSVNLDLIWVENRFTFGPEPFEYFALPSEFRDVLWMPHLQSKGLNSFNILQALEPWKTVYLTNDSEIHYEIKANVNFRCNMKFDYFPMDVNFCPFTMWVDKISMNLNEEIKILDSESMKAEPFHSELWPQETEDGSATFNLVIKRRLNPFIMKYYLPSIGIVFISQMSFVIHHEQLPARVAVLVTSFLILANTISREQAETPTSPRMTALGIYLIACLVFILVALIELFVLLLLTRTKFKKKPYDFTRIDIYSLILTSLLFLIFNLAYWMTYLSPSDLEKANFDYLV